MNKNLPYIFIPTDMASEIFLHKGGDMCLNKSGVRKKSEFIIPQHIYILSDDKDVILKDGNWVIYSNELHEVISDQLNFKVDLDCNSDVDINDCKKIIATTNLELHKSVSSDYDREIGLIGVDKISKSDIEYIISLYNQKAVNEADELREVDEILSYLEDSTHGEDGMKITKARNILSKIKDKNHQLLEWIETTLSASSKLGASDDEIKAYLSVKYKIESITKEHPNNDTVLVEYENSNSGWQQLANSGKAGSTFVPDNYIPKIEVGNIVIVRK